MFTFVDIDTEDLEELKRDVAMLKKLKKKKITNDEYEKEIGLVQGFFTNIYYY